MQSDLKPDDFKLEIFLSKQYCMYLAYSRSNKKRITCFSLSMYIIHYKNFVLNISLRIYIVEILDYI